MQIHIAERTQLQNAEPPVMQQENDGLAPTIGILPMEKPAAACMTGLMAGRITDDGPSRDRAADVLAMARSIAELGMARLAHRRLPIERIHHLNRQSAASGRTAAQARPGDAAVVDRVAHILPRVAEYMPWRSDCLVQAMAAQRWLDTKGIATSIIIGVDLPQGALDAHAWLQHGDRVVTGGTVDRFKVLLETPASSGK